MTVVSEKVLQILCCNSCVYDPVLDLFAAAAAAVPGAEQMVDYKRKVDVASRMARWIAYGTFSDKEDDNVRK